MIEAMKWWVLSRINGADHYRAKQVKLDAAVSIASDLAKMMYDSGVRLAEVRSPRYGRPVTVLVVDEAIRLNWIEHLDDGLVSTGMASLIAVPGLDFEPPDDDDEGDDE